MIADGVSAGFTCNGIGYFWFDGTLQNSIVYGYDNGGNVATCDQGWYKTTYGYDGADQLTSETGSGSHAPPSYAYTYDHNANRLSQTTNGTLIQNFAYDAHDKLTSGTLNAETDGYDANGNKTGLSFGGLFYGYTYDDEDRLVKATYPGQINTYTYNGLGLRVGMTDSAGVHTYLCDGTSPGSPVLSDGFAVYTPGLSEHRNGASLYYANDQLGNLWTVDASGKSQTFYEDTTAFGTMLSSAGTGTTPFKFGGGNGCQTDADTQMVLMGHRYYDARTGRFLSQDPAGDGDNWYAYARNSPTNAVDPEGLWCPTPANAGNPLGQFFGGIGDSIQAFNQTDDRWLTCSTDTKTYSQQGSSAWVQIGDTGWVPQWSMPLYSDDSGMGAGGMFASPPNGVPSDWKQIPHGPNGGMEGPNGQTRWINPEGTEGLEHHPPKEGNHGGQPNTHPLIPKPNGNGWTFTNPKKTIIVGSVGIGAVSLYFLYQGLKDTVAVAGAPETGGASLVLIFVP